MDISTDWLHAFAYRFIEIFAPHLQALDLREAAPSRLSLRQPRKKEGGELLRIPAYGELRLANTATGVTDVPASTKALPVHSS